MHETKYTGNRPMLSAETHTSCPGKWLHATMSFCKPGKQKRLCNHRVGWNIAYITTCETKNHLNATGLLFRRKANFMLHRNSLLNLGGTKGRLFIINHIVIFAVHLRIHFSKKVGIKMVVILSMLKYCMLWTEWYMYSSFFLITTKIWLSSMSKLVKFHRPWSGPFPMLFSDLSPLYSLCQIKSFSRLTDLFIILNSHNRHTLFSWDMKRHWWGCSGVHWWSGGVQCPGLGPPWTYWNESKRGLTSRD